MRSARVFIYVCRRVYGVCICGMSVCVEEIYLKGLVHVVMKAGQLGIRAGRPETQTTVDVEVFGPKSAEQNRTSDRVSMLQS